MATTTTTKTRRGGRKEAEMATIPSITTTFQVSCPCGCDESVTATDRGFSTCTVEVTACSKWAANGIRSTTMRKSWGYEHAIVNEPAGWRHRDGLVTLVGC